MTFAVASIPVTSPVSTRTLACRLRMSRATGAMDPSDKMPVATWYSSGWNRWLGVLLTSVA
jgi:hypothetical protein